MPPKSDASLRYKIIDKCLTNIYKPYPTMNDLIYKIERELKTTVSKETLQKDIGNMKKSEADGGYNAPIKFRKSRNGYYYDFDNFPDFTIQTFGLNDKEIEAIELAAGVLQHFKGIKINDTFNQAIDKLLSAVDIKKTTSDKNLTNAIQPEESTYMRGMEYFDTLIDSIKNKKPISFIYYSYDKKSFKAIIIHPYLLKESNKRWYLIGYSEDHKEIRYFGIDRIYDPLIINKEYIEQNDSDLRDLFANKIGLSSIKKTDLKKPQEVVLWFSKTMANYIKSMPIHISQVINEYKGNGDILVTLNLVPTFELNSLIFSYGKHVELIKPQWLRKEIEKEFEQISIRYKRND
jgi:predicted DNA-binding transcriptional regulator YafY